MMKKLMVVFVVITLIMGSVPAFAEKKGSKGASEKAYEQASKKSVFNRANDWFSNLGKPKEEKATKKAGKKGSKCSR
ncbi:hypothetical protein ACFL5Y_02320 [Candidatus Omnitrophota bacterium]